MQVAFSKNTEARRAYEHQSALDSNGFVAFRGRELCPGGRLVVPTAAPDEDGEFGYRPLNEALMAAQDDIAIQGLVRGEEVRQMVIPVVGRTEKDFRAPFAPRGWFEGLAIEHLDIFNADDRCWARYQSDSDAEAFGAQWAAFARTALFPTLRSALDGGLNDPRGADFVQRLEADVGQRLAKAPEPMRIPLASLVLTKRDTR